MSSPNSFGDEAVVEAEGGFLGLVNQWGWKSSWKLFVLSFEISAAYKHLQL